MGKKNQQPRTKGNARPSSSQSAADFLQRQQQSLLVGFDGTAATSSATPAAASFASFDTAGAAAAAVLDPGFLPATEEAAQQLDSALDSELHFALRRLTKRDAVTKQKALSDLLSLLSNRPDEALEATLPFWTRLYARLALDSDRRVRELAQPITGELAVRLKKRFPPNLLRETLPYWLMSQADPSESVANAAKMAFQRAFSEVKRCSAVVFAFDRTLQVALETLDTSAPLKPADVGLLDSTNCDFTRLVYTSLGCLQYLLNTLTAASDPRHRVAMVTALSGQSAWRYSPLCQQSSPLAAAHLRLATTVCTVYLPLSTSTDTVKDTDDPYLQSLRQLIDKVAKGNADLAMTSLWSEQPTLVQCGLDASLSLVRARPQLCWNQHAFRKRFLPRLRSFLSASVVSASAVLVGRLLYPSLLPLFSILPLDPTVDKDLDELVGLLLLLADATVFQSVIGASGSGSHLLLLPCAALMECGRYLVQRALAASAAAAVADTAADSVSLQSAAINAPMERLIRLLCNACSKILTDSNLSSLVPCASLNLLQLLSLTAKFSNSTVDIYELAMTALLDSLSSGLSSGQPVTCALAARQLRLTMSISRSELDSRLRSLLVVDGSSNNASGGRLEASNIESADSQVGVDLDWPPVVSDWLPTDVAIRLSSVFKTVPLASVAFGLSESQKLDNVPANWLTDMPSQLAGPLLSAIITALPIDTVTSLVDALSPDQLSTAVTYWLAPLTSRTDKSPAASALLQGLKRRLDAWLSGLVESVFSSSQGLNQLRPALDLMFKAENIVDNPKNEPQLASLRPRLFDLLVNRCDSELEDRDDGTTAAKQVGSLAKRLANLADSLAVYFNTSPNNNLLEQQMQRVNCRLAQLIVHSLANNGLVDEDFTRDGNEIVPWPNAFNTGSGDAAIEGVKALALAAADSEIVALRLAPLAECLLQLADSVWPSEWLSEIVYTLLPSTWNDYLDWLRTLGPPELTLPADRAIVTGNKASDSSAFIRLQSLAACTLRPKLLTLAGRTGHGDLLRLCLMCSAWLSDSFASLINQRLGTAEDNEDILGLFDRWLFSEPTDEDIRNGVDEDGDIVVQLHLAAFIKRSGVYSGGSLTDERLRTRLVTLVTAPSATTIDALLAAGGREFEALVAFAPVVLDYLTSSDNASDSNTHRLAEDTVTRLLSGLTRASVTRSTHSDVNSSLLFRRNLRLASAVLSSERYTHEWTVVQSVLDAKIASDPDFLVDTCDAMVDKDSAGRVADNCALLTALYSVVSRADLTKSQWDFALCSLAAWLAAAASLSVDQLAQLPARHPTWRLLCRACHLASEAAKRLAVGSTVSGSSTVALSSVKAEWLEFFSPHLLESELALFNLIENLDGCSRDSLLARLCLALSACPAPVLLAHRFPPELHADDAALLSSGLTPALQTLLNRASRLAFDANQPAPVSAAFAQLIVSALPAAAEGIAAAVVANASSTGADFEQDVSSSDASAAGATDALVPLCLRHRLRKFAVPVPDPLYSRLLVAEPVSGASWLTPADACRVSRQLLNGLALLHLVRVAQPAELRARLAEWLSTGGYLNQMLLTACPLLPANPSAGPLQPLGPECGAGIGWRCCHGNQGLEASSLALDLLVLTLRHLPALFRNWRASLTDRRLSNSVDKYVKRWISPALCDLELRLVQTSSAASTAADGGAEARELTVKARPASREIVASYQVTDEHSAELLITLPVDYPLGQPTVEMGKRVGIPSNDWRRWQLQMAAFLRSQNGSLLDGIDLWKRNVDKKFEGIEDCMICYSILHGSNYRLPDLQCRVCRKRFHRACMRQWFETSQNPTCPLCRNTFDFITRS